MFIWQNNPHSIIPRILLSVQRESFWICSTSLTSFKMVATTARFGGSFSLQEIEIIPSINNLEIKLRKITFELKQDKTEFLCSSIKCRLKNFLFQMFGLSHSTVEVWSAGDVLLRKLLSVSHGPEIFLNNISSFDFHW